ncbi:MAG: cytochrome c [Phycisphaerales bacterium JB059]
MHHVFEATPGVYSGAAPKGEEAFEALRTMGVRTIISVDGARPDVELAEARGLRYAHVPIGYDGVDAEATAQLARALRDAEGPVYVHCHHGKHRGPAAAAAGLIALGRIDADRGVRLLEASGTSPAYPGLWASVRECGPLDAGEIEGAPAAPAVAPVDGFVAGMAIIDRAWDNLKLCREAGWGAPSDHPDLAPASEAGIVAETLRRLNETAEVRDQPEDFVAMMLESQAQASRLEGLIVGGAERAEVETAFAELGATCKACHVVYRN